MRDVHPDANANDPLATRKAARLNVAFETLGDPEAAACLRPAPPARPGDEPPQALRARAEQPDWEDIVADSVSTRAPVHVHNPLPTIEPDEIEVDMAELRDAGARPAPHRRHEPLRLHADGRRLDVGAVGVGSGRST